MEAKTLHEPFDCCTSDLESWTRRPFIYHFFEIVQILEGQGVRHVNQNNIPFSKGNIFLFTPLDCRGFESTTPTRFRSIRFSEVFLGKCKNYQEKERLYTWLKQLEQIFFLHNRFQTVIVRSDGDCEMITSLMGNIIAEYTRKPSFHEENLQHMVTLVLNILLRNIKEENAPPVTIDATEPLINKMLVHIHHHIAQPEKLRVRHLAESFHLSATYVGEYFRRLTGESLQSYITQYKIQLVRQRLIHSNLSIGEIAAELGYTDESHLGRQFRKHQGASPAEVRKKFSETRQTA